MALSKAAQEALAKFNKKQAAVNTKPVKPLAPNAWNAAKAAENKTTGVTKPLSTVTLKTQKPPETGTYADRRDSKDTPDLLGAYLQMLKVTKEQGPQQLSSPVLAGAQKGLADMFMYDAPTTPDPINNRTFEEIKALNPKLTTTGYVGGIGIGALPSMAMGNGIGAARFPGASKLGTFGASVAADTAIDIASTLPGAISSGISGADYGKAMAINTGANVALGGIGLGLSKLLKGRPVKEALQDAPTFEAVKKELDLPVESTVQEVEQAVKLATVSRSDVNRVSKPLTPPTAKSSAQVNKKEWRPWEHPEIHGLDTGAKKAAETQPLTPVAKATIDPNTGLPVYGGAVKPKSSAERWASLDMDKPSAAPKDYEMYVPGTEQPGKKVRRTVGNSAMNSPFVPDAEKARFASEVGEGKHIYEPTSNIKDFTNATERVEADYDKAVRDFYSMDAITSADDTTLGEAVAAAAYRRGDNETGHEVISRLAEMATKAGQATQAIAIMKRMSPEGMLYYATRQVDKAKAAVKKAKPAVVEKVEAEVKKAADDLATIDADATEQAIKELTGTPKPNGERKPSLTPKKPGEPKAPKEKVVETPAQKLAKRIVSASTPKKKGEIDMVKRMVDELLGVAKESPLPEVYPNKPVKALDRLSSAIKDREKYVETWNEAKQIVMNMFKNADQSTKDELEAYFEKGIRPTYQAKTIQTAIEDSMRELDINMGDIARRYYSSGRKEVESLKDFMVRESGLSGTDAELLASRIEKRIHVLAKEKKEVLAKRMFGDKPKVAKLSPDPAKKIEEKANLGLFVNSQYENKILEKLTPDVKTAMKEANITLDELVRLGADAQTDARQMLGLDILNRINVPPQQRQIILEKCAEVFNALADAKRQKILNAMLVTKKRPVQKSIEQKVYELINLGAFDNKAIRDLLYEKKGIPSLSREEQDFIVQSMEKARTMGDGRQKDIVIAQIKQLIADKQPTSISEKVGAGLRAAMLLNPKTLAVRNPLGNVLFATAENVKQIPATAVDVGLSKLTGKRTTAMPRLTPQLKGAEKGLTEVMEDIKYGIDTSVGRGGAELPHTKKIFNDTTPVGKLANRVHGWMANALMIGDRPFYEAAKQARLDELKRLGPKAKLTAEEVEAEAMEAGLVRTFQEDSGIAEGMNLVKSGLSKATFGVLGQGALPFVTTGANIMGKGFEYTPLGLVKLFGKAAADKVSGKVFNQKAFADTLGRTMTGSAIAFTGYKLAEAGFVTGSAPRSEKARLLNKEVGVQDYSFKFGDGMYSFDWAAPGTLPLAFGADMYFSGKREEEVAEQIASGVIGATDASIKLSVLRGVSSMLGGYSPAEGIMSTAAGVPLQALPTAGSQFAAMSDPYQRQYESGFMGGLKSRAMAKVPGLRQQMPVKLGLTGQPLLQNQGRTGVAKATEVFLSPGNYSKLSDDAVMNEVKRLYDATGNSDVIPGIAPDSFTPRGKTAITLSAEQRTEFQKVMGAEVMKRIRDVINGPTYKNTKDEKLKAKMIASAVNKARAETEKKFD